MMHLRQSLFVASILAPAVTVALVPQGVLSKGYFSASGRSTTTSSSPNSNSFKITTSIPRGGGGSMQPMRMISNIMDLLGGGKNELIAPEKALKGRDQKMPNIDGSKHYVLGTDMTKVPEGHEVAVFANGCFWGSEKGIWRLPFGIYSTAVGYCGGFTPNPTYEECCSGLSGHTEGVRVVYDPTKISFVDLLRWHWECHDPTSGMGQGNDRGTQYRSGFYYFDDEQKQLIEASKEAYEKELGRPITTEIAPATDYDQYGGLWYYAESYHQQYLAKPGARPYCSAQPQGKSLPPFESWAPPSLKEKYEPKLSESFWKKHGPKRGCSVVQEPNDPIEPNTW